MQDLLHVEGHEQEDRKQRGTDDGHRRIGAAAGAVGHDAQWQQWPLCAVLDEHKRGQQHRARREGGDGQPGRPGVALGAGEAVDKAEEPGGGGGDPGEVDPRARTLCPARIHEARCGDGGGNGE